MEVQNTYFSYFFSTLLLLNHGPTDDNTFAHYPSFSGYEASQFHIADDVEATDSLLTFPIRINFQDESTNPPAGYEKDYGEAYDLKTLSGLTYGWVTADGKKTPLDLVGNGRNRNREGFSVLENTFMHMQYDDVGRNNGMSEEGMWEIALPDGNYLVSVAMGDANNESLAGTHHMVNAEGVHMGDTVAVLQNSNLRQVTKIVTVSDGHLTLDALGGFGTKIVAVEIKPAISPSLMFSSVHQDISASGSNAENTLSNTISTSDKSTPVVNLLANDRDDSVPQWLKVEGGVLDGTIAHDIAEPEIVFQYDVTGLLPGNYTATVIATASGYTQASFTVELIVTKPPLTFPIRINFQDESTNPPAGYEKDYGEAYDLKTLSGLTYGWVTADGKKTPLDLVGNGRNRNREGFSVLENTFMHMQYDDVGRNNEVSEEGMWEIALPDGNYLVSVAMGDANNESLAGTHHMVNAEGVHMGDTVAVLQNSNLRQVTKIVTVSDGHLTLDALGGFNTKINAVVIGEFDTDQPFIVGINIPNGARDIEVNSSVSTSSIIFPNIGQTINDNTLNDSTVFLKQVSNGTKVTVSSLNSTGGGDALTLTPADPLQAFTEYEFVVTSGLKDLAGAAFIPFSSTFTTGGKHRGNSNRVAFTKSVVETGEKYTSLVIGPDEKLYGMTSRGMIHRWIIHSDGSLSEKQIINSLKLAERENRLGIGMAFDPSSTSDNLILWVSHSTFGFNNIPDWGGKITKLSGPDLDTVQDYVINLPRSIRDHATNSIAFKPGEPGALYIMQGSNTAMGLPDVAWGNRPERLLNAAVLKLNIAQAEAGGLPLDAKTEEGGTYNPFAPSAALTLFATGIRNAYDLLWHSNGQLYVPANGSAGGGHAPSATGSLESITPKTQNDFLYRVVQNGYYGHPNPLRDEWILNGGNPTALADGADEVPEYAIGTQPDPNYRGYAYDFEKNKSPNGVIEYKGNVFNGALQGKLLVIRYSQHDDIIVLTPGGANKDIVNAESSITGCFGFNNPLDLVEHTPTGNIYVSEYGAGQITLLKPDTGDTLTGASIALENMTKIPGTHIGFPADDFYTFHRNAKGSVSARQWHDTNVMRIHNSGTHPLSIDSLVISDDTKFSIINLDSLPFTGEEFPLRIEPGAYQDVTLEFIENAGEKGLREEKLTIFSNADNSRERKVALRGTFMLKVEGGNEVNAQEIMHAFGFTTSMNRQPRPSSDYPSEEEIDDGVHGDLILSKYFVQADPTQPVRAFKMAAFKGEGLATTKLLDIDSDTVVAKFSYKYDEEWHQSLLPKKKNTSTGVAGNEADSISVPFRISIDNYKTSGGNYKDGGVSQLLGVRVYKVYNRNRELIPYHYIVLQDYIGNGCGSGSANCDWNDNVEYFINIKPVDDPLVVRAIDDLTVMAGTSFRYDVSVYFDHGYPGNKLTYAANLGESVLPEWLIFDSETGVFSGIPPANATSGLDITVKATDVNGIDVFDEEATTFTMIINKEDTSSTVASIGSEQPLTVTPGAIHDGLTQHENTEMITFSVDGEGDPEEDGTGITLYSDYAVYPNPVGETLHIRFLRSPRGITTIHLSDLPGKTLFSQTFNISENDEMVTLDLSGVNIDPSLLLLKIETETNAGTILRLIKK